MADISQPEYIFSQITYEAFHLLQDGFKWTGVMRVKKKKKSTHRHNTRPRRKSGHPQP
jgi:hypothetical protein